MASHRWSSLSGMRQACPTRPRRRSCRSPSYALSRRVFVGLPYALPAAPHRKGYVARPIERSGRTGRRAPSRRPPATSGRSTATNVRSASSAQRTNVRSASSAQRTAGGTTASTRCGPSSAAARRSASARPSAVSTEVAGTPMPRASATKSSRGRAGPAASGRAPRRRRRSPPRRPAAARRAGWRRRCCCRRRSSRRGPPGRATTARRSCTSRCRRPAGTRRAGPGRPPRRRSRRAGRSRSRRR